MNGALGLFTRWGWRTMLYCGLISVGLVGLSWVITAQQLVQQQWMPPLEQGQLLAARGAGAGRSQLVHACMPCKFL